MPSTRPYRVLCDAAQARGLRVAITLDGPRGRAHMDALELWSGRPSKGTMIARTDLLGRTLDEAADALMDELRAR